MAGSTASPRSDAFGVGLRFLIVGLALVTAYVHATLGGLLFTLNAVGYVVLAGAMVAPLAPVAERRWLVRVALLGYTAATIGGYLVIGPHFTLGWITKGIELALVTFLVVDIVRTDGGPAGVAGRVRDLLAALPRRAAGA